MDRAKFWAFAKSDAGIVIPNAEVEVFIGDSVSKPTLYADREGTEPLTNPFNAEDNGFFEFYVDGGRYRVEMGAEGATFVLNDVLVGTAQGLDAQNVVDPADLHPVATSGDHSDLNEIGVNTHPQIDAHIASTSNPHDTTLQNLDDTGIVGYTNRHCLVADGSQYVSRALVEADISDLQDYILGVDWGDIGGTLTDQTDLNTALGLKANTADLGAAAFSNDHSDLNEVGTNTHAQIDSHIADDDKHREINDSGTGVTDLWSADKIITELDNVEVGTVATDGSIDGTGATGSPLSVADDSINAARLSPQVRNRLLGAYAHAVINENLGGAPGPANLDIFDTALIDTDFDGFSIVDGEFIPDSSGIYLVSFSCFAAGDATTDAEISISGGASTLVTAPLYIYAADQVGSATATAIARISPGVPLVPRVLVPSSTILDVQEGTHVSIAKISSLDE